MRRGAELLLAVAAVLLAAILYLPIGGFFRVGKGDAPVPGGAYFHDGKGGAPSKDPACLGEKCHATSTHRRKGPESAFLNMHEGIVSCLSCHGKDPARHWRVPKEGGETSFRLAYDPSPDRGRHHDQNGPPATCPRCHSPEGRQSLQSAGLKRIGEGFEDPIALRMIGGGGRKWVPDTMR